jgi:hypothetical protein
MMNPIFSLVIAICRLDSGSPDSSLGAQGNGATRAEDEIDEHCRVSPAATEASRASA